VTDSGAPARELIVLAAPPPVPGVMPAMQVPRAALTVEHALSLPEWVARALLRCAAPVLSVAQACGVLRVTTATPWPQVEARRVALVQASSPWRLRDAPAIKVAHVSLVARMANAAYLVLARARQTH
jgi:hypothetical protein